MRAALAALAVIAALCVGLYLGGHPADLPTAVSDAFVDEGTNLNTQARQTIEDHYYRKVGSGQLDNASISGMVDSLRRRFKADRYSHYFDPRAYQQFQEATSGRFSGIGLSVTKAKKGLRVVQVFHGSPAPRAGIRQGDVIVGVNGKPVAGQSSDVVTAKIKGPVGTTVKLRVLRPATGRARTLDVKRAEITVPVVTERIVHSRAGKLGYVRLAAFTAGVHGPLRAAVKKLEGEGARGIVLDLRGNGGGLLNEAVLTASIFIPRGRKVVETRSRSEGGRTYRTVGGALPRRPLVVLIDRNTASAAEILASAIADDISAPVVGTRSFGKGVFQQVIQLPNDGALDLTIGEYFTPTGISLAPNGIKPDVFARDRPATRVDEALQRALAVLSGRLSG